MFRVGGEKSNPLKLLKVTGDGLDIAWQFTLISAFFKDGLINGTGFNIIYKFMPYSDKTSQILPTACIFDYDWLKSIELGISMIFLSSVITRF